MPVNRLLFADAASVRDSITNSQKRQIKRLYDAWADELATVGKKYQYSAFASGQGYKQQTDELVKMIRETGNQLNNEILNITTSGIYEVSNAIVKSNRLWMRSIGLDSRTAFINVPDRIVRRLITGDIYKSGWSLSRRIWTSNTDNMRMAYEVVAGGIAQNKSIYDISNDLARYVSSGAKKPWNLLDKDGRMIYPKQVDYNAQRLARTLTQHGYQQSFIEVTKDNPFVIDYVWDANGSRVCPICLERNGKHYKKDELPLDHPNGMCTMIPNIQPDLSSKIIDWINSPVGTYNEIDKFALSFGYNYLK